MIGQAPLKINSPEIEEDGIPKPFIKWAGGKRSLEMAKGSSWQ
ncbi:MAG: hypothetical protein PG979_000591 [Rickettsia asembonensis]|nr:MAG: hypothetical protein PG979_000591 [Rickettsia asembonensis]